MKTIKEYALEFSEDWKQLGVKENLGMLESHLKDEISEYFCAKEPHSASKELADIIIIANRMLLELGYDPDESITDKASVVRKRMDLAKKIFRNTDTTLSGIESYKLAKHILEGSL